MKLRFSRFERLRAFRSPKEFAAYAEKQAEKYQGLEETHPSAFRQWGNRMLSAWNAVKASGTGRISWQGNIGFDCKDWTRVFSGRRQPLDQR